jgi:hypothetical protein
MRRYASPLRAALLASVLGTVAACAGLHPTVPEVTTAFEPPAAWQSGVRFMLGDPVIHHPGVNYSTRVEFVSSSRAWVVTNGDLFEASNGEVRTPWYRLRPREDVIPLRFTVEHPGGARTVAEYPLFVKRGEFYSVGAGVYTRKPAPSHAPYLDINPVAYPLNPAVAAQPGDSLWISFTSKTRDCFDCPT